MFMLNELSVNQWCVYKKHVYKPNVKHHIVNITVYTIDLFLAICRPFMYNNLNTNYNVDETINEALFNQLLKL